MRILIFLMFPIMAFGDAVIFSGNDVKTLKQNIDLFGVAKIMSGSLDPSAGGGVAAPQGSLYLSTVNGVYEKTGAAATAWTKLGLLPIDLASDVTGVLPLANGGSNKALTASAGSVLYSDADSFEFTTVGTTGQALLSNGTGAPAFGALNISTAAVTGVLPIANGGTNNSSAYTAGSIVFSNGTSLTQDNTNLFWDDANNRLGIGGSSPAASAKIDIQGTDGALLLPRLTTTQRNALTPTTGMMIYNSTTAQIECYYSAWGSCEKEHVEAIECTSGGTLPINLAYLRATYIVESNPSGAVTCSTTPFGAGPFTEGTTVTLMGANSSNTITILSTDITNGTYMNGDVTLSAGETITFRYLGSRWAELSRSN